MSRLSPLCLAVACAAAPALCQESKPGAAASAAAPAATIDPSGQAQRREQLERLVTEAKAIELAKGGLCGVLGGARVKLLGSATARIQLPIPQRTPSQQPVVLAMTAEPSDAVAALRIRQGAGAGESVEVVLRGKRGQEVRLDWAAVVLLLDRPHPGTASEAAPFLRATACAQAEHAEIRALAERVWPAGGSGAAGAARLQQLVREQKQTKPPRSLDALGILSSGANTICTGNANLAVAVLRSRGVPARSLAVVPTIGQRLEMHRIVEWFADDAWHRFDPSSVTRDVPMHPWHSVVMATTTPADEDAAQKPRLGVSLGCPFGQELEVLEGQVTPWGQDLFWTEARPLAAFAPDAAGLAAARDAWNRFLATGKTDAAAERAAAATAAAEFAAAWQTR